MSLRTDAQRIMDAALKAALPDTAVVKALEAARFGPGRLVLVAAGKAAWQMAAAAVRQLGERVDSGVVITKYGHSKGPLPGLEIYEAGHPVPDENSFKATQTAIEAVSGLTAQDTVLFLLSGGGSALFEKPLIPPADLDRLTHELLASGADIVEMNTVRKRFSAVKGGRFAALCAPARVFSVVLSDIIGDPLDMIASGPAYPDSSTEEQARAVAEKYGLTLTEEMRALLAVETPKSLDNVETHITGSVRQLCLAAQEECRALGYTPVVLTASLSCTAREAGAFLANIAQYHHGGGRKLAFLAGGETVVRLTGGRHEFIQCTISNYYLFSAVSEPLLSLYHCLPESGVPANDNPLMRASFENCIVYGLGSDINEGDLTGSQVFLRNVLLKSEGTDDDNFINCLWGEDPLFYTVRSDYYFNYRLKPDSPAIGAGNREYVNDPTLYDMDGLNRLADGNPALGAYVFVPEENPEALRRHRLARPRR